jgi:fatty-acyl-CoA synthase
VPVDAGRSTIAALLEARAGDDHPALIFEDRTWSWSAAVAEATARSAVLKRLRDELPAGAPFHVGVLLENVAEFVWLLFGAALAGATVVGINPTRRGAELERDIRHTNCQRVFTSSDMTGLLDGLDLGAAAVVTVDGPAYREMLEDETPAPFPDARPGAESLYLLLFTAGSTGAPKAVRMSQGRAARTAAESARAFGRDDVLYCAMPLFHGNALVANLFPALVAGASVVLRRRFSASAFGPDIRRFGCTYFNYVGRALSYVLAVPETPSDADNRLRWALGSEASPQNIAEFARRFRCPIFEGYGSTENAVVIAPAGGMPPGALGRPREGIDVAIVDPETGQDRSVAEFDADGRLRNPADAVGEIVGRNTASWFEGYYNNPDADATRTRNGWYWTGDLGYRDADGWVYFAGRTADWLRVDGENFSAGPVERILNRWGPTSGVAVYAVPDPVTGDQVMAAVEMADPAAFDVASFQTFLAGQPDLGPKWVPRFVRVLSQLPVTGAGKVDKAPLRAQAWSGGGDPVWWRPAPAPGPGGAEGGWRVLTPEDGAALAARFAAAGRDHLLPAGVVTVSSQ